MMVLLSILLFIFTGWILVWWTTESKPENKPDPRLNKQEALSRD